MPVPNSERKQYFKEYRARKKEEERLRKRDWYQETKPERLKKLASDNAKRGHKPRKTIAAPSVRVTVPKSRRFVLIAGRVYFNSQLGFDADDLRHVILELNGAPRDISSIPEENPRKTSPFPKKERGKCDCGNKATRGDVCERCETIDHDRKHSKKKAK